MILKRVKTLFAGKEQNITKHVYRVTAQRYGKYVLGVYTMDTAKFYPCDRDGKKLSTTTLDLFQPPDTI